jgi:hypothetical protein
MKPDRTGQRERVRGVGSGSFVAGSGYRAANASSQATAKKKRGRGSAAAAAAYLARARIARRLRFILRCCVGKKMNFSMMMRKKSFFFSSLSCFFSLCGGSPGVSFSTWRASVRLCTGRRANKRVRFQIERKKKREKKKERERKKRDFSLLLRQCAHSRVHKNMSESSTESNTREAKENKSNFASKK